MKKGKLILIAIAALALVAIFTNPSLDSHKDAVRQALQTSMNNTLDEKSSDMGKLKDLGKSLGNLFGNKLIDASVNEMVSRDNYLVYSTTKCRYNGEDYVVGVGLFGHVFVSSKLETVFQDSLKKLK